MKFTNIVYDMIVEEVKNKSLINSLLAKWQTENESLTYQDVESIYEKFAGRIQNGIRVDKPEILTFLNHFDGVHTKPKFPREPNLLKDITKYTYTQIIFLIDEYDSILNDESRMASILSFTDTIMKLSKKELKQFKTEYNHYTAGNFNQMVKEIYPQSILNIYNKA